MKFDPNANPPCFSNPEDQVSIERNARVRLKIVGTRVDATEIVSELAGSTSHLHLHD
jgi:DNA-directed RNA polymerase II subunit RPB7